MNLHVIAVKERPILTLRIRYEIEIIEDSFTDQPDFLFNAPDVFPILNDVFKRTQNLPCSLSI
jgi:hypothetical protein